MPVLESGRPEEDFADDTSVFSHALAGILAKKNIDTFGAKIEIRITCGNTNAMRLRAGRRYYAPGSGKLHQLYSDSVLYGLQIP